MTPSVDQGEDDQPVRYKQHGQHDPSMPAGTGWGAQGRAPRSDPVTWRDITKAGILIGWTAAAVMWAGGVKSDLRDLSTEVRLRLDARDRDYDRLQRDMKSVYDYLTKPNVGLEARESKPN